MQELENVLKEIEQRKNYLKTIQSKYTNDEINIDISIGYRISEIQEIESIIRNHMSDGWIPVDEKLPNSGYECEVTLDNGTRSIAWYNKIDYVWFNMKGYIVYVIAWKEPSKPYNPEGSEK